MTGRRVSDYHARRFAVAIILWCVVFVAYDWFAPESAAPAELRAAAPTPADKGLR